MSEEPHIWIGNQTAFSVPPLEPFEYAVDNGFDAFEWFPDKKEIGTGWDENDLTKDARVHIRKVAATHQMRLSVHARWQTNPADANGWQIFFNDLELAEQIGASLLNIHLHTENGSAYVDGVAHWIRRVAESGLQLSIENSAQNTPEEFNELFDRLRSLGAGSVAHVGMCLDIGHANLSPSTRNDFLRYVERLDERVPIIHLHLHENWGDYDNHLPLFSGPAGQNPSGIRGLIRHLRQRRYSGSMILEQWPQPPSLLNQAREKLIQLLAETP